MNREDEPEPLRPGQIVGDGRYLLGEVLGRGGLATVFAAQDRVRGREVALKVLRVRYVGRPEREERLRRELEYARRVEHPAVIEVYELGVLEGRRPFFAMERVRGRPLSQVLSGAGRLAIDRVVGLTRAIAEALEALHRQGIVHRDVKPANVLVLDDDRIKLLDLGMAGDENAPAVPAGHTGRLTRVDDLLGTHEYMAPEQVLKAPPHRAMDVFSLGVVMYELLAGLTPYSGMKVREYVALQVEGDPHVRSAVRWARLRGAPVELAELIDECRLREPGRRPGIGVVIERLERIAAQQAMRRGLVLAPARGLARVLRPRESAEVVPVPVSSSAGPSTEVGAGLACNGRHPRRWAWRAAGLGVPVVVGLAGWLSQPAGLRRAIEQPLTVSSVLEHEGPPEVTSKPSLAVARPAEEANAQIPAVEPLPIVSAVDEPGAPTDQPSAVRTTPATLRERPNLAQHCERVRENANAAAQRRDWAAALRMAVERRCWVEPTERLRLEVRALAQLQRWEACMTAGRGSTDDVVETWVLLCNNHTRPNPGGA